MKKNKQRLREMWNTVNKKKPPTMAYLMIDNEKISKAVAEQNCSSPIRETHKINRWFLTGNNG